MQKSNAIPHGELFRVDEIACLQMARTLLAYKHSKKRDLLAGQTQSTKLAFKIGFIAICHKINWDFLQDSLAQRLLNSGVDSIPEKLSKLSADELQEWLAACPTPERIKAKERSKMVREVGRVLLTSYMGDASRILSQGGNRLMGPNGFIEQMDKFGPYAADPVKKKTNVLTHDLVRENIVEFVDADHIEPAIDYHLIRLYIRSGRVNPVHSSTVEALATVAPRIRESLVTQLRRAVAEAVRLTAKYSNLSVPDVNYIEWQLGRNICIKGEPNCVSGRLAPELDRDVAKLFDEQCPYQSFCYGFINREWLAISEPVFKKSFY